MPKNPIFALLWIALLWFITWPVASLCCGFWLLIQVCSCRIRTYIDWRRDHILVSIFTEQCRAVHSHHFIPFHTIPIHSIYIALWSLLPYLARNLYILRTDCDLAQNQWQSHQWLQHDLSCSLEWLYIYILYIMYMFYYSQYMREMFRKGDFQVVQGCFWFNGWGFLFFWILNSGATYPAIVLFVIVWDFLTEDSETRTGHTSFVSSTKTRFLSSRWGYVCCNVDLMECT